MRTSVKTIITLLSCLSFFLLVPIISNAQQKRTGRLLGTVIGTDEVPVEGAVIRIQPSGKTIVSSVKGEFSFDQLSSGEYSLSASVLGYQTTVLKFKLIASETTTLLIKLVKDTKQLSEVNISGMSTIAKSRMGYNVTAIDATKLHNTTYDLNQALNKVSGVRVRESGGLGSSFDFSLNGFSGNQVKFFLDGMPMDNFGTSMQMNNIPVNIADRIEVYKGVVPVKLGADALGGAINIITNANHENYLDISYSYGSFNTHRSAINAGYVSRNGFTLQLNAFQNYSDNDYNVDVDVADLVTGLYTPQTVRRFHDQYHNETVILNTGIIGKRYADKLLFGITLGQNDAQIQTGNRMFDVYGGRSRKGTIVMPSVKYAVNDLFTNRLNFAMNANFNLGHEQLVDTLNRQYNWLGQYRDKSSDPLAVGGELSRTLYRFKNNSGTLNGRLNYSLGQDQLFNVNNTFTTFNRKGVDELSPDNVLNKQPRKNEKNILGAAYQYSPDEPYSFSVFFKNYNQSTIAFSQNSNQTVPIGTPVRYIQVNNKLNRSGYGTAISWLARKQLELKASYEHAFRLPDNDEIFGNPTIDLLENTSLKPERSDNFNLGISFRSAPNDAHHFSFETNVIYRNAKDFIRPSLTSNGSALMAKMLNQQNVLSTGIDGTFNYTYKNILALGFNATYQNLRNNTKYEPGALSVSDIYHDRIPNIPYFFGNADASVNIKDLGKQGNILSLAYHLTYVHEYFLNWPSHGQAGTKPVIPGQIAHDLNALYTFADGRYNVGLECRNLFDAKIFDRYSLQKPGRAFNLKVRYFIRSATANNQLH